MLVALAVPRCASRVAAGSGTTHVRRARALFGRYFRRYILSFFHKHAIRPVLVILYSQWFKYT